jgi:hypothetical protein
LNNLAFDADGAGNPPEIKPEPIGGVDKTFSIIPRTTFAAANDIGAPPPVEPDEEFDTDEPVDVVDKPVRLLLIID